jgi:hypothetical protein
MNQDDGSYSLLHVFGFTEYEAVIFLAYNSLYIGTSENLFGLVLPYQQSPPISEFVA